MKDSKRRIREEKLAKLFYEMGMDLEVVSKISGVEISKIVKLCKKDHLKESYE